MFNKNFLNEINTTLLESDKWMQKNIDPWLYLASMLNPYVLLFFIIENLDVALHLAYYSSEQNEINTTLLESDKWMQKNIDPWLYLASRLTPYGLLFFIIEKLDVALRVAYYSSEQKSEQNLKTQEIEMMPLNIRP